MTRSIARRWRLMYPLAALLGGCPEDSDLPPPPIASVGLPTSGGSSSTTNDVITTAGGVDICPGADGTTGSTDTGDTPCMTDEECGECSICIGEVCVGTGQLRFTLTFTTDSDFDLHVITPDETEIFFGNTPAGGGDLDVDQCIEPCGSGTHVENIFFAEMPPCGEFTTYVVNYDGRAEGDFEIEVEGVANGDFSGSLEAIAGATSESFMFTTCR